MTKTKDIERIRPLTAAESRSLKTIFGVFRPAGADRNHVVVVCGEHKKQKEWVPQRAYHLDLGHWYAIGIHPRFSVWEAFAKADQSTGEADILMGMRDRRNGNSVEDRQRFQKFMRESSTPEEFLAKFRPWLFTDLETGDQKYRVAIGFKEKFEANAFTVDDFFAEDSQELRRLILRSGLSIQKVIERMDFVAEDEEGKLYEIKREREQDTRGRIMLSSGVRYLYVVCPSTGQEYLLGVPGAFKSPREARRWTFGVESNATFVKEA